MKSLFMLFVFLLTCVNAQEVAFVRSITGHVDAKLDGKVTEVKNASWLDERMVIHTQKDSEIKLIFKDDSILVLGENSILVLEKYLFEPENKLYDFQLKLNKGVASFESGKIGTFAPDKFIFKTPESTVAIRGTKFIVRVQ